MLSQESERSEPNMSLQKVVESCSPPASDGRMCPAGVPPEERLAAAQSAASSGPVSAPLFSSIGNRRVVTSFANSAPIPFSKMYTQRKQVSSVNFRPMRRTLSSTSSTGSVEQDVSGKSSAQQETATSPYAQTDSAFSSLTEQSSQQCDLEQSAGLGSGLEEQSTVLESGLDDRSPVLESEPEEQFAGLGSGLEEQSAGLESGLEEQSAGPVSGLEEQSTGLGSGLDAPALGHPSGCRAPAEQNEDEEEHTLVDEVGKQIIESVETANEDRTAAAESCGSNGGDPRPSSPSNSAADDQQQPVEDPAASQERPGDNSQLRDQQSDNSTNGKQESDTEHSATHEEPNGGCRIQEPVAETPGSQEPATVSKHEEDRDQRALTEDQTENESDGTKGQDTECEVNTPQEKEFEIDGNQMNGVVEQPEDDKNQETEANVSKEVNRSEDDRDHGLEDRSNQTTGVDQSVNGGNSDNDNGVSREPCNASKCNRMVTDDAEEQVTAPDRSSTAQCSQAGITSTDQSADFCYDPLALADRPAVRTLIFTSDQLNGAPTDDDSAAQITHL